MYDRRIAGKTLTFGHAGILYEQSFVMYDRQTGSRWVHVTGRAEEGPLEGHRLKMVPSTTTTWGEWKRAYPHTLVLGGQRRGGFMGTFGAFEEREEEIGLLVAVRDRARLYPFKTLAKRPVINDTVAGQPVAVFYTGKGSATAWNRRFEGSSLAFREEGGEIRDERTGSRWSRLTGEAMAGPLKGKTLRPMNSHPILIERFSTFYPEGTIFGATP